MNRICDGCYQRVLVLTPNNHALFRKWVREVDEFKRRCVAPSVSGTDLAFTPLQVDRLDDLAVALRKPGRQPQVIVARMGLFGGDKLVNYDLKRRFLLGVLFRYWGISFNYEQRHRLLKGAPNWPSHPDNLTSLTEEEDQLLPFSEDQLLNILRSLNQTDRHSSIPFLKTVAQSPSRSFAIVKMRLRMWTGSSRQFTDWPPTAVSREIFRYSLLMRLTTGKTVPPRAPMDLRTLASTSRPTSGEHSY